MKPKPIQRYERFATLSLAEGFTFINMDTPSVEYEGKTVSMSSLRLRTFKEKGIHCMYPECELEGKYFAIEISPHSKHTNLHPHHPMAGRYHMNLWGDNGMLFTHDHILARCFGGRDHISNAQTMCERHNALKGKEEGDVYTWLMSMRQNWLTWLLASADTSIFVPQMILRAQGSLGPSLQRQRYSHIILI